MPIGGETYVMTKHCSFTALSPKITVAPEVFLISEVELHSIPGAEGDGRKGCDPRLAEIETLVHNDGIGESGSDLRMGSVAIRVRHHREDAGGRCERTLSRYGDRLCGGNRQRNTAGQESLGFRISGGSARHEQIDGRVPGQRTAVSFTRCTTRTSCSPGFSLNPTSSGSVNAPVPVPATKRRRQSLSSAAVQAAVPAAPGVSSTASQTLKTPEPRVGVNLLIQVVAATPIRVHW
jgi:hypothetical protein